MAALPDKRYLYTCFSILWIAAWHAMFAKGLGSVDDEWASLMVLRFYFGTVLTGLTGGIVIFFFSRFRNSRIRSGFLYNLVGTLNLIIGMAGFAFTLDNNGHPFALFGACSITGFLIYFDIYRKNRNVLV